MKKEQKALNKNLKTRLSSMVLLYLDGLSGKKRKKVEKYLDGKLGDVVDFYAAILKKKKSKQIVSPPPAISSNAFSTSVSGEVINHAEKIPGDQKIAIPENEGVGEPNQLIKHLVQQTN